MACRSGHLEKVASLLNSGIDINTRFNQGESPLIAAVRNGHYEVTEYLINHGAHIDIRDSNGRTPLIWAAKSGHEKIVRLLIQNNADIHAQDNYGKNALMYAVAHGNPNIVSLLLEHGADIHKKCHHKITALLRAASNNHLDIFKILVYHGADIETIDIYGNTALMYALQNRNVEMVQFLIDKGANIHVKNSQNETTLFLACRYGLKNIAEYLLQRGIDPNIQNDFGETALMQAITHGHYQIVELLLKCGADMNIVNKIGKNALIILAIKLGSYYCESIYKNLENLIDSPDYRPDYRDLLEIDLNIYEEINSFLNIVSSVIQHVKNDELENTEGYELLKNLLLIQHRLILEGKYPGYIKCIEMSNRIIELSKQLIRKGVQVSSDDDRDYDYDISPIGIALRRNLLEIVKLLIEHPEKINPVHFNRAFFDVIETGNFELVKMFVEKGVNINTTDGFYNCLTPLTYAIRKNNPDIVKYLIQQDARVNFEDPRILPPLVEAVRNGNIEMVQLLIENGAEVNSIFIYRKEYEDDEFSTPLIEAFMTWKFCKQKLFEQKIDENDDYQEYLVKQDNLIKIIEMLIKEEPDILNEIFDRETPLTYAVEEGLIDIVELLIRCGADVNKKNKAGQTPLEIALRYKKQEIADLLINHGAYDHRLYSYEYLYVINDGLSTDKYKKIETLIKSGVKFKSHEELLITLCFIEPSDKLLDLFLKNNIIKLFTSDKIITFFQLILFNRINELKFFLEDEKQLVSKINNYNHYIELLNLDIEKDNNTNLLDLGLLLSIKKNHSEMVKIFLEHGANPNLIMSNKNTLLHYATNNKQIEIIELLIKHGADLHAENSDGVTPFMLAARIINKKIIRLLINS
ncbi:MAG: hypothetical protein KatS3mg027_2425 [Bacteroidia bacterium]|nr:MAG: hypothetical protein KatS3mg027_2425 [Bacteroidia bacterium]